MTTTSDPAGGRGRLAGRKLGPYDVLALIGAGGMGEVYRARDPRLQRDVAIKVLPADLASSPDALARFRREARAVAALSHPNILSIYELATDEATAYAVTELLEGETLRQRLTRGPLSPRQALGLAVPIAEGLAAAHAQGVIHRDLKPENIFLTAAGLPKILDFGLARMAGDAVTTPSAATQPGTVMGTVGYMSPEQVRGELADARSDVFSFGCVLYEMLRGAPPFHRPTAAETMTAILRDDPLPLAAQVPGIPGALEGIVAHCLEKQPKDRFQSTADMVFALRAAGTVSGVRTDGAPAQQHGWKRKLLAAQPWLLAALITALAATLVLLFLATRDRDAGRPERYTQLTFERGTITSARFGADRQTVVFSAAWEGRPSHVFVKLPDNPDAVATGSPGTELLAVSSSGDLAVRVERLQNAAFGFKGTLARMPVLGGAARRLTEDVAAADWLSNDSLAVVRDLSDRQRLDCGPGTKPYETHAWISDLRVAPGGGRVAFIEHTSRDAAYGHLVVYDCGSGARTELAAGRDHLGVAWHPQTRELWFGEYGGLRAIGMDGAERTILQLPESVRLHDIAPDGRVLLSHETLRMRMALRRLDDERVQDLSWQAWSLVLAFTPDSKNVLFTEFHQAVNRRPIAALRGVDGSPVVQLGEGFVTSVSKDGRWAAALRDTVQQRSRLVLLPMGTGEPRTLPSGPVQNHSMAAFLPSGEELVFIGREAGHGARLYRQSVSGGEAVPISPEGLGIGLVSVSPDGAFVVTNWRDNRPWLFPTTGGEPRSLPGVRAGDIVAGWAADSRHLYIRVLAAEVPLRRLNVADGSERTVAVIRPPDPSGASYIGPMIVAPDERSVAFNYFRALSSLYLVEGLR